MADKKKRTANSASKSVERQELFSLVAKSRQAFCELIDSFDRIAFNVSLDGRLRVINREFASVVGLPFSSIVDHPLQEFLAEPTRAEIEPAVAQFIEKRFWTGVLRIRWRHSNEVCFYDCVFYAVVEEGKVVGASGLARDISGQRVTESRFTDLFETLHEGVYFSDPEGNLLDVNPAMVRMLGYKTKEEVLAKNLSGHLADASQRSSLLDEIRKAGALRDRQIVLRRKNGSLIRVLSSSVAIRDASGQLVRFQGSLVDISERLEIERRLREEQEFVRRLIACFPDVIVVLDTEGRYTFASPRVQEFLGYTPEEYLGENLEHRPHPEDRQAVIQFFRGLIGGDSGVSTVEYRTRHKDGHWRTFRASASPLTDAEGKVIGIVASARDVTESKRIEQQLVQSEKLAAIGQMVSGVAHELNNPLTAILGVSDLLYDRAGDDASRRHVELIRKQARKAADLVQGLLTFSQPSRLKSQNVRLEDLVARALELQRGSLEARNIIVEFKVEKDLPLVAADPNHIVQVFVNLFTNAEQAISSVRHHGSLKILVSNSDQKLQVMIEDDGPGIPPEIHLKIFDPFFTTRRPSGGAGLGLTISLVIVKEHGGTLEALPSAGGGARFRILLPASQAARSPQEPSSASNGNGLKDCSILVVDDEEGIRELIKEGLAARAAVVDAVSSSEEAWNHLSSRAYDVVLCDFNLGKTSGTELFERVMARTGKKNPRFLFMSGELLNSAEIAALEEKDANVLQKPFQLSELVAALEKFISVPSAVRK
ncbi:MAG TPA: PAS domain S-box protein [Candidatus Acidoferrales bacterium]|nr:PAS domain S-box protein [Candidatus Acidoferrales bacterium]